MDSTDHEGHGGNSTCNSHMLWNWETKNVCIVFSWWSVNSIPILILSCLIVLLLATSFEVLRNLSRKYDRKIYSAAHSELEEGEGDSSNSSAANKNRFISIILGAGLGYFFFGKHTISGTLIGEREIVGCH
ncbi:855_t:CDS:2 [Diversispora eburnea]|uniref:Copper transport protein n=1 Tax=Diversispora eburnea TaxID=1213867 RepID=A0A9N8VQL8_9GLOM|nr:855_t:CDS:2 [Diversispora eburnea]